MITRFRSRDAAWAAAKKLSGLVPGHDYEAWPDRGYCVLVMRYRDDDGHLRFKFVGPADRLTKKHNMREKTRPQRILRSHASPNHPPQFASTTRANNIGVGGDESARRHRRVYVEAMQQ
jgi:hypothetical protein